MMHDACRGFDNSWEKVAKTWVSELLPEDVAEFSQKSEPNTLKQVVKRKGLDHDLALLYDRIL